MDFGNMPSDDRIDYLIVDSSPFIRNIQLQTKGKSIYTISEVVNEIKDKATRERLQVLPYELTLKNVTPEAYNAVVEFSKKTGDYPSLSCTDLKLIALTYQLTKEFIGTEHLRTTPEKATLVRGSQVEKPVGFYAPSDAYSCEDDENDEDGWITSSSMSNHSKNLIVAKECGPTVACMTCDFALQNVLMQMGLHIVSVDGFRIKENRTFILRCFACFKTTTSMSKKFCHNCGNKTLKRVSVAINENGEEQLFISRRPLNIRGTKFSLPSPTGGKFTVQPELCEDQRFPHQRQSDMSRKKFDPLSPDFIAEVSPFALNDVHSRAAHVQISAQYFNKKNPNVTGKRSGNRRK
uniref:RNA-binding protein NOB1 n=1 Tax=Strigamia maritima TaxID=126957 RepID=T1J4A0_STRMM